MLTPKGHLTYCSNIHSGETWNDHFARLQEHIPLIKQKISPVQPFGIGLRLSNTASLELRKQENLEAFQKWLNDHNCYVFTMNGFPYGGFHNIRVKDNVHAPDWTSPDRVAYTIRLAQILAALLPDAIDGGISTSPISYRFWHKENDLDNIYETATLNLLQVVDQLIQIKTATGKLIHIDIEPEPDGLLGDGKEFLDWYVKYLLPLGVPYLQDRYGFNEDIADSVIKEHIQICYDVCHFAICYEDHGSIIRHIQSLGIKTGKIQISAALKARMPDDTNKRIPVVDAFKKFNESTYLHQVVARQKDGHFIKYADMPDALADASNSETAEWRAHFHVPLFIQSYGVLESTQNDIEKVLSIQKTQPLTSHLEIETYTWEVLPEEMRLPLTESIIREMQWVISLLNGEPVSSVNDKAYE
jgi:hypothetical protein